MSHETRARRRIREAVEATGRTVDLIEWEPIHAGGEMQGAAGGWTVMASPDEHALGYNLAEVLEWISTWEPVEAAA